jgi:hypothetical protein
MVPLIVTSPGEHQRGGGGAVHARLEQQRVALGAELVGDLLGRDRVHGGLDLALRHARREDVDVRAEVGLAGHGHGRADRRGRGAGQGRDGHPQNGQEQGRPEGRATAQPVPGTEDPRCGRPVYPSDRFAKSAVFHVHERSVSVRSFQRYQHSDRQHVVRRRSVKSLRVPFSCDLKNGATSSYGSMAHRGSGSGPGICVAAGPTAT